jgi:hypothetical protein
VLLALNFTALLRLDRHEGEEAAASAAIQLLWLVFLLCIQAHLVQEIKGWCIIIISYSHFNIIDTIFIFFWAGTQHCRLSTINIEIIIFK